MKLRNGIGVVLLACLVMAPVFAADAKKADTIDGKWTGDFEGAKYTWEFKSEGDKVSGTSASEQETQTITDIKMEKGKYVWTERVQIFGQTLRMNFTGTLKGDKLKITAAAPEGALGGGFGGPGGPGGFGGPGGPGGFGGLMQQETTAKRAK